MKKGLHSIKFKLIAATLACVAVVSLLSSVLLYRYLSYVAEEKSARIQQLYLETMQEQMDKSIDGLVSLALFLVNDWQIGEAMLHSLPVNMGTLDAQSRLNISLRAYPGESYVDKFIVATADGRIIQASARQYGRVSDLEALLHSAAYRAAEAGGFSGPYTALVCPSITDGKPVFALLCPMQYPGMRAGRGFVYLELGLDAFTSLMEPYTSVNNVFLLGPDGEYLSTPPAPLPETLPAEALQSGVLEAESGRFRLQSVPLSAGGMTLYTASQTDILDQEGLRALYVVGVVFLTGLVLAFLLAFLLSAYLTRPIQRLKARIERISANDFSFDPAIERARDEIGEIGHTVNEMSVSIQHLLQETESMYQQRQNIEIKLLQSQVNPHFLYNTLDSIRWMAVIQKCPGIASMLRSLVNLLKNIAKGTQDRIPLQEELALLDDYIAIQSVRYMETFTFENNVPPALYDCRIIKLTLQPLVENAIFHGIEPTGECGTITLSGREEAGDVLLTVEDNGAGIPPETLATLLTAEREHDRSSMNGIGVANVHRRLQLTYGKQYGLSVESEPGKYTRVTVRFPKETGLPQTSPQETPPTDTALPDTAPTDIAPKEVEQDVSGIAGGR